MSRKSREFNPLLFEVPEALDSQEWKLREEVNRPDIPEGEKEALLIYLTATRMAVNHMMLTRKNHIRIERDKAAKARRLEELRKRGSSPNVTAFPSSPIGTKLADCTKTPFSAVSSV